MDFLNILVRRLSSLKVILKVFRCFGLADGAKHGSGEPTWRWDQSSDFMEKMMGASEFGVWTDGKNMWNSRNQAGLNGRIIYQWISMVNSPENHAAKHHLFNLELSGLKLMSKKMTSNQSVKWAQDGDRSNMKQQMDRNKTGCKSLGNLGTRSPRRIVKHPFTCQKSPPESPRKRGSLRPHHTWKADDFGWWGWVG